MKIHSGDVVTKVRLQPYHPVGVVPDTRWLPAWAIGYLLLTAFFFFAGKRLAGIY